MTINRKLVAASIAVAALSLSACNVGADPHKGMGDAGLQQGKVSEVRPNQNQHGQQNTPADIINFSDKYPNVEFKCNGVDGIYVNTRHDGYMVVIPNDPECK